jgi:IS605 OrfB family transposase
MTGKAILRSVATKPTTCSINGGELRALRHYQNSLKAKLDAKIDRKERGSNCWKKLAETKRKQLGHIDNKITDLLHKLSRKVVEMLLERRVSAVAIGDTRGIRDRIDYGTKMNQRLHQWQSKESTRHTRPKNAHNAATGRSRLAENTRVESMAFMGIGTQLVPRTSGDNTERRYVAKSTSPKGSMSGKSRQVLRPVYLGSWLPPLGCGFIHTSSVARGAGVRPKAKATGSLRRTRRISRLCPGGGLFEQPGEKSTGRLLRWHAGAHGSRAAHRPHPAHVLRAPANGRRVRA